MKIKPILLTVLLFGLVSQPAYAIRVSGLYQTTVPVASESSAKRSNAIKQALIQVLIKLTGDRNIQRNPNVGPLLDGPQGFVQQFRYRQVANEIDPSSLLMELQVKFDQTALDDALRNYGITVWSNERPAIVVWLAHEGTEGRQIVSYEESPEYLGYLDKRANARGISLLFPLLDLEDTSQVRVSDVWGSFKEPIKEASSRYDADVILTGKLAQLMPDLWEVNWTVYIDGDTLTWSNRGNIAGLVLEEGIDELADRLAARFANIGSTQAEIIQLQVSNVNNLDQYARILKYLEGLQSVRSVQVKKVSKDKIMFEIISLGGLAVIDQAIGLGNMLEPAIGGESPGYRLITR